MHEEGKTTIVVAQKMIAAMVAFHLHISDCKNFKSRIKQVML